MTTTFKVTSARERRTFYMLSCDDCDWFVVRQHASQHDAIGHMMANPACSHVVLRSVIEASIERVPA